MKQNFKYFFAWYSIAGYAVCMTNTGEASKVATFNSAEDALEYVEFKAGKVTAKAFHPWFESLRKAIVATPIEKSVVHPPFNYTKK
jgi:hypothetical protein